MTEQTTTQTLRVQPRAAMAAFAQVGLQLIATAFLASFVAPAMAVAAPTQAMDGGDAGSGCSAHPYAEAAADLSSWAGTDRLGWAFGSSQQRQAAGDSSSRSDARMAALEGHLQRLLHEAPLAPPAVWAVAVPSSAMLEASVDASRAERRLILARLVELASLAPTSREARKLERVAVRIAEPLVHPVPARSSSVSDTSVSHDGSRWAAFIRGTLESMRDPSNGSLGAFANNALRRIEELAPGQAMPRFLARDTAGNEVRSAHFQGSVTVFRFWSVESPASVEAHRQDAALVRTYWDAPFELVGVSKSAERQAHLDFLALRHFGGTQVFDGPISTTLADELAKDAGRFVLAGAVGNEVAALPAWNLPTPGSLFVVDARGVIRGRDLVGDELTGLVDALIAEERARQREVLQLEIGPRGEGGSADRSRREKTVTTETSR